MTFAKFLHLFDTVILRDINDLWIVTDIYTNGNVLLMNVYSTGSVVVDPQTMVFKV
jgi:hypothetical protein